MNDLGSRTFYSREWRIDPPRSRLFVAEREFKLEPRAMAVLVYLASRQGSVVAKRELLDEVWQGRAVSDDVLTVSIYGLRKILGDSAHDPRFIATVPRKGYRWIAPISDQPEMGRAPLAPPHKAPPNGAQEGGSATGSSDADSRRNGSRLRLQRNTRTWLGPRARLVMAVAAGVILVAFAVAGRLRVTERDLLVDGTVGAPDQIDSVGTMAASFQPERMVSLAVLPFTDLTPGADDVFFAEALNTELVDLLVSSGKLQVSGRTSAAAAQKNGWTIPEIGERLDVRYVLEGSVQRDEEELRVTVQLSDALDGFYVWSERYSRQLGDIFELQDEIADTVAKTLDLEIPADSTAATLRQIPTKMGAYEAYLKGRYHWHQGGKQHLLQAVRYFERAIELDPHYAAAYSGLADSFVLLPVFTRGSRRTYLEKARDAAEQALALDDRLAEAQTSRAEVRLWLDGDPAGAEEGLRRAIELNPHYGLAHHRLGNLLFWERGRLQEALGHLRWAERSDPLNLLYKKALGHVLVQSGAVDEARTKFLEAEASNAGSPGVVWGLARCSFAQGQFGEAVTTLERFLRLDRDGQQGYRRLAQFETLTASRHFLGDHQLELEDALAAQKVAPNNPWALQMEARARAALGEVDAVKAIVARVLEMPAITERQVRWWLRLVGELHWHGHPETAAWVASGVADWYRERDPTSTSDEARLLRFKALALWASGQSEAAVALYPEISPAVEDCDSCALDVPYLGEVGSLAALAGDRATAERFSSQLREIEISARGLFWQAAIAAGFGDRSRAVDLLRQSFASGFGDHAAVHSEVFFIGLYDYQPFRQLAESEWGGESEAAASSI